MMGPPSRRAVSSQSSPPENAGPGYALGRALGEIVGKKVTGGSPDERWAEKAFHNCMVSKGWMPADENESQ